eukprot:3496666-Rhodomonas_salina.1
MSTHLAAITASSLSPSLFSLTPSESQATEAEKKRSATKCQRERDTKNRGPSPASSDSVIVSCTVITTQQHLVKFQDAWLRRSREVADHSGSHSAALLKRCGCPPDRMPVRTAGPIRGPERLRTQRPQWHCRADSETCATCFAAR